mmetsp:Transcript_8099/g.18874  ORF Transcript_8099/g.18874 Transcript_8099/m.18874 type:complete len:231 (-) Transcript_8099:16-708(-)
MGCALLSLFDTPKSASLATPPSPMRMFCDLRSLCNTLCSCRYASPLAMFLITHFASLRSNGTNAVLRRSLRVPPGAHSITMFSISSSIKHSWNLITLGCCSEDSSSASAMASSNSEFVTKESSICLTTKILSLSSLIFRHVPPTPRPRTSRYSKSSERRLAWFSFHPPIVLDAPILIGCVISPLSRINSASDSPVASIPPACSLCRGPSILRKGGSRSAEVTNNPQKQGS